MSSAICLNFDQSKIFSSCNGLKCMTHLEVPGLRRTESSGFCRNVLWQDASKPQPSTGDTQEVQEHLRCHTEPKQHYREKKINSIHRINPLPDNKF